MSNPSRDELLRRTVEDLLEPLARLCVAQGLPFAQAEELFKQAYVREARAARRRRGADARRDVSQVAMATGLSRREVDRLTALLAPKAVLRPAPATQLFTRWMSQRRLRGRDGLPRPLPRVGAAPSFESLATAVTRHVHPRSLLDELVRLGLVRHDEQTDLVHPLAERVVPGGDEVRLQALLAANVGDHLAAAVANVLGAQPPHLEQAVFGDGLRADAVPALRERAREQWRAFLGSLVPAMQAAVDDDPVAPGEAPRRRMRVGFYTYDEAMPEDDDGEQN